MTCPVLSVVPEPITLPSLSSNSTFVFGSVVTSTGSVVVALPVKSLVTKGAVGGVVSVAFSVQKLRHLGVLHYRKLLQLHYLPV